MKQLTEGRDYYINDEGLVTFTASFLLERGYCCGNGCRHCPYQHENVSEAMREKMANKDQHNQSA
jgi:hypothetical protein